MFERELKWLSFILPDKQGLASGGWALLAIVVTIIAGFARAVMAARLLGPSELGTVGIALLVLASVDALTSTGTDAALVSHPGDVEKDLHVALTLRALQGVVVASLVWIAAPMAAHFFDTPAVAAIIRWLALVPLLRGFSNPAAILLVRRIEFRRLFWWGLPETLTGLALVIGVGLVRRDAWALVASVIGSQLVALLVSYAIAPGIYRFSLNGPGVSRLLHYAKWMQGTRTLMFVGLNLDNFMVGRFLGASALGLYQIAFRLGELPVATIGRAAAQVTLPLLTRLRSSPSRLRTEYLRSVRLVTGVTGAFAFAALFLAGPVVKWIFGPAWLPIVPVVKILAFGMVFRGVTIVASELFSAIGRPRLAFVANAARVAVMAITIYPLLRSLGAQGVAVSVLLSCVAGAVVCWFGASSSIGRDITGVEQSTAEEIFTRIYRRNEWASDESVSGPGSTLARGASITPDLRALLRNIDAKVLLDAPCGDMNWVEDIADSVDEYIGVDIVRELIDRNSKLRSKPNRRFIHADLIRDALPKADVVLCRDALVHFSDDDVWAAVRNIKRSESRFILTTTFVDRTTNPHVTTGGWRPLNLECAPFFFGRPVTTIDERCVHSGGIYRDKRLALWDLASILSI